MTAGQNRPYAPDDEVHVSDAHASAVHSREVESAPKGLNADIDSALEQCAGIQSTPLADARERQVILRAMAIAYSVSRCTALLAALLLSASGLWWAAIAVALAVVIPGMVAKRYARKRGVDLYWQSGVARNETSVLGLALGTLVIMAVSGLIAFDAIYGHPLLAWSWHVDFSNSDGSAISIFVGAFIGGTIGWILRRRRYRAKLQATAEQSTNAGSG